MTGVGKSRRCATARETLGTGQAVRTSVWLEGRARRPGRGRQPRGLDRDRVVGATVRLPDAEGLTRFSMRRLAAELNVTAMAVYWYVDTKDDLLELALDAAFGELRLPGADADEDWREQLRALATEYRMLLVRHPWLSPLAGTYLNVGPEAVSFTRAVQRTVRRTGLPVHLHGRHLRRLPVRVRVRHRRGPLHRPVRGGRPDAGRLSPAGDERDTSEARSRRRGAGLARIMAARGGDSVAERYERDFRFALELLVAGIEAMVVRG